MRRRTVTWRRTGVSRTVFTQAAVYEIGAFLTVFQVRQHHAEFRAVLESADTSVEEVTRIVEAVAEATSELETPDEPRASRIDRHTRDFVLEALHQRLSHREFEEFTADLLRAMGYEARATAYLKDGGVDVIAHRDALGVEPPLIKVQCKHLTGTVGAPDVQRLIGAKGHEELALFVTLGGVQHRRPRHRAHHQQSAPAERGGRRRPSPALLLDARPTVALAYAADPAAGGRRRGRRLVAPRGGPATPASPRRRGHPAEPQGRTGRSGRVVLPCDARRVSSGSAAASRASSSMGRAADF